jgi:hypothetical protein
MINVVQQAVQPSQPRRAGEAGVGVTGNATRFTEAAHGITPGRERAQQCLDLRPLPQGQG